MQRTIRKKNLSSYWNSRRSY